MNSENIEEDFIERTLKSQEDTRLEFKQKITSKRKIAKTIAAMANALGGTILIGISDQKRVVGIDPEEERYMVESANATYCVPSAQLTTEEIRWEDPNPSPYEEVEKLILKVNITKSKEGPISYLSTDGSLKKYKREGDQSKLIV